MNRLFKLQFVGPLVLFCATLCAELAAQALARFPSSELLWFINLKIFGIFQRSSALLSYQIPFEGFQFYGIALPILLLACLGLAAKSRPSFTLATHLSVVFACFLIVSWQAGIPGVKQASLGVVATPSGPGLYLMATLFGACLLSFVITHLLYFVHVAREIRIVVR